jgi:lysophospholipase L1-like esterase
VQATRVRKKTVRLPEAAGVTEGQRGDGPGNELRIVVLGESTAAGVGADNHDEAVAGQLAKALAAQTGRKVSWRAVARSGATMRRARERLAPSLEGASADVVVVMMGVNDTIRLTSGRTFRRETQELLSELRRYVDCPVILSGIPPVALLPALPQPLRSALGTRSRLLDRELRNVARGETGVFYSDIVFPVQTSMLARDGFHPSPKGYEEWGRQLAESVMAAVSVAPAPATDLTA